MIGNTKGLAVFSKQRGWVGRGTESMNQMSISLNSLPHCFAFTYRKTTSVNSGKHVIISVFLAALRFYLLMEV